MKYMLMPFRRFFDFQGRSRRMEFWMFFLFNFIVGLVFFTVFMALFIGAIVDLAKQTGGYESYERYDGTSFETQFNAQIPPELLLEAIGPLGIAMIIIMTLYSLLVFIPNLAVTIRRLHDQNRSGWWIMLLYGPYLLFWVISLVAAAAPSPESLGVVAGLSILLMLVMIVGGITLLVFMFLEGTRGPNRFGQDPKGPDIRNTFY